MGIDGFVVQRLVLGWYISNTPDTPELAQPPSEYNSLSITAAPEPLRPVSIGGNVDQSEEHGSYRLNVSLGLSVQPPNTYT